ncbi:tetratricopeptide repeat protein [Thalassotalea hakodatensis]|uniref:hypothetical protein n=1 Tax=Thalassotalea hakodatensis TaxID=3030492 RepID=UPI0025743423|nr:hypothetical protein [Thalassotalea hakodatensis]
MMKLTHPTLLSLSMASMLATASPSETTLEKFKIAVIKDTTGSSELMQGDYTSGMHKLTSAKESSTGFDIDMGLCAANLKHLKFEQAEEACSDAIEGIDAHAARSREGKFIKALALSNRGIVRYLQDDSYGALEDFSSALLLSDSKVIKDNLAYLKVSMSKRTLGTDTVELTE